MRPAFVLWLKQIISRFLQLNHAVEIKQTSRVISNRYVSSYLLAAGWGGTPVRRGASRCPHESPCGRRPCSCYKSGWPESASPSSRGSCHIVSEQKGVVACRRQPRVYRSHRTRSCGWSWTWRPPSICVTRRSQVSGRLASGCCLGWWWSDFRVHRPSKPVQSWESPPSLSSTCSCKHNTLISDNA